MKTKLMIGAFMFLIMGGILASSQFGDVMTVVNEQPETITVEKVVEIDTLNERIEKAQEDAREDIEKKAQDAYDAVIEEEMTAVADQVKRDYIAEIEETISDEKY